jgi:hypothetical protein
MCSVLMLMDVRRSSWAYLAMRFWLFSVVQDKAEAHLAVAMLSVRMSKTGKALTRPDGYRFHWTSSGREAKRSMAAAGC